jgi:hypothetical protein
MVVSETRDLLDEWDSTGKEAKQRRCRRGSAAVRRRFSGDSGASVDRPSDGQIDNRVDAK